MSAAESLPRDPAGRLPPHDLDAEGAVLGAVLDSGEIDRVSDLLTAEDFYSDANQTIYAAALAVQATGAKVSQLSVATWLRDREQLAKVGGAAYVAQLSLETPWVADIERVARGVRNKARVRRLIATSQVIAAEGYGDVGDIDDWINSCEARVHAVAMDRESVNVCTFHEALVRVFTRIQQGTSDAGLRTGLPDLDRVLGPMQPGQLVLIGALSGIGKSALALNMALEVAMRGAGVLVFSAEMEADELATRALFAEARVDSGKVNAKDRINVDDWARLAAAAERIGRAPMWIDDRPAISPAQVRSRVRRLQSKASKSDAPLGLIVVDYVQLLDGKSGLPKGASRENEVAEIARQLKVLAKESQLPVLALAQLNSDAERAPNGGRKPRLNDLRESKAIGQNADKVILIHNPAAIERAEAYRNGESVAKDLPPENVDLIVAKNRGGRTGTVPALFWPSYTLFTAAMQEGEYQ